MENKKKCMGLGLALALTGGGINALVGVAISAVAPDCEQWAVFEFGVLVFHGPG